jgi:hypothetical protein
MPPYELNVLFPDVLLAFSQTNRKESIFKEKQRKKKEK